jgi:hypothetical protein
MLFTATDKQHQRMRLRGRRPPRRRRRLSRRHERPLFRPERRRTRPLFLTLIPAARL